MYLILVLICILSSAQTCLAKIFQKETPLDLLHLIIYNLLNASFASIFFLFALKFNIVINFRTVIYAIIFASLIMVNLCASLFSMKHAPLPIVTIVNMASGIILPTSFGILFFKETLTFKLILASVLILSAAAIPFLLKNKNKRPLTGKAFFWCALSFVLGGACTILMQLYAKDHHVCTSEGMFFVTNVIIVIACIVFVLIYTKGKPRFRKLLFAYKPLQILNIASRTLINNIISVLQIIVLASIPVSFYSVFSSSFNLLLTTLISIFLFKEKHNKATLYSLILALAATITNAI